jgi:hypothetical protein
LCKILQSGAPFILVEPTKPITIEMINSEFGPDLLVGAVPMHWESEQLVYHMMYGPANW